MAIYNGTHKIKMSGVDKVYVGTQLVYQKAKRLTNLQMTGWDTTYGRSMSYQGVNTAVWYQNQYDTFKFNGGLYATYSDGSVADVTNQCTFSGYNMSTASTQDISVSYTYNGVTMTPTNFTSFKLSVVKEVDHLVLSGYKSQLDQNSSFDFGGTVTAYYTDNSTEDVTADCTFSGYDMSTLGTYTVTVTYSNKWYAFGIFDYITSSATQTYQLSVMTPTVYRKLEYIHFSGAEKLETNFYAGTRPINHQFEFSADVEVTGTDARTLIGMYNQANGDAFARWYLIMRQANGIRTHLDSVSSNWATNFNDGDKLKLSCTYTWTNSSKPCFYWYLFNQTAGGGSIGSAAPLIATTSGEFDTTHVMYLGCQYNPYASTQYYNFWIGHLYNYQRRQTNASGALLSNYVPCQRKSDSICGMYDTITNTFLPMTGTSITSGAAGPTVEEYWDPTA